MTISSDKYDVIRYSIALAVRRRGIHTIFHQKNRAAAWTTFYSDCICDTGIMKNFMYIDVKAPAQQVFRRVVNAGLDHDSNMYTFRGTNDEEPNDLEILSDILVKERGQIQ